MMKSESKRRRTRAQIEAEKVAKDLEQKQIVAQLSQVAALKQKIEQLEEKAKAGSSATELLTQMMNSGLAKQTGEGTFVVHGSKGDQEFEF